MVPGAAGTARERAEGGLTEPTFRGILLTGLPGFLREGFLPLGAFYAGLRLGGLSLGIGASAAISVLVYAYERRVGRDGLLVRLSLGFVAVQSAIGLAAHSTTVFLAQPVVANAVWGVAFLASAALRRPLAGTLACAWYPFPRSFRQTDAFRRVFGVESVVWGAYFVVRSGIRLAVLLQGSLESFLVVAFLTGTPTMLVVMLWSIRYALRRLAQAEPEARPLEACEVMRRTGPLRDRLLLRALRAGVGVWRLGQRFGFDLVGATEAPRVATDDSRRDVFERLIAAARARGGAVEAAGCPYPLHEFLTYLAVEHGLLLHGSNHASLEMLEPRPARDFATELRAVVACDDGIWPVFYAVVARDRVDGVFTACMHLGRRPRLRRFYLFSLGGDPASPASWTRGAVYALPRTGFRREWGQEWVSAGPVRPLLRVPVGPEDFPLREAVRRGRSRSTGA